MKSIAIWLALILGAIIAAFLFLTLFFNVIEKQDKMKERQELNDYWLKNREWQRNII